MPASIQWDPPEKLDGSDDSWPSSRLRALSYSIGVLLKGDGSICITRKTDYSTGSLKVYRAYKIALKNKSIRFIRTFNTAISKVLHRRIVRIATHKPDGHFQIQFCSKAFVSWWLAQKFSDFQRIIEAFPIDYLRGRFDSDCNVHGNGVVLHGAMSQLQIMEFERNLCIKLGMRAGKLRPYGRPGEITNVGSKMIVSKEQKVRFYVNVHDFLKLVKYLNVEWRDRRLKRAIKRRQWTPWTAEIRAKAIHYKRSFGWSAKETTEALRKEFRIRISYSTVYSWLSGETLSWDEHANASL
jgi:intein-encoded DNA endonuclease-like protein